MSDVPPRVVERFDAALREAVALVLTEPDVLNTLLERHVVQLIDAGDLVPRERLQVGAGVELCPAGLEQAARAVITAAADVELPEPLRDAFKELDAILHPVAGETEEPASVDEDVDPETEAERHCEECDAPINAEQALISQARWQRDLCPDHHATEGDRRKKASRPGKEPDA